MKKVENLETSFPHIFRRKFSQFLEIEDLHDCKGQIVCWCRPLKTLTKMSMKLIENRNFWWNWLNQILFNPVWAGGADLPTLTRIPKYLIFALQTHAEIGWLFMYVHYGRFKKKWASYVPWFNFDGIFFDKKSGFQIANFFFFFKICKKLRFFQKPSWLYFLR